MPVLIWFRQRGFVFWFSVFLVLLTMVTLIGMLAFIGESQDNISFSFLKAKPDLSLSITASPQTAERNGSLIYTVVVTNEGPGVAKKIVVDTTLPDGVTFTSAQPPDPACFESEGVVNCRLGALNTTESVKAIISVKVEESAPQALVTTAVVQTSLPDSDASNDTASVSTPVK